jgi:hypothetical protein
MSEFQYIPLYSTCSGFSSGPLICDVYAAKMLFPNSSCSVPFLGKFSATKEMNYSLRVLSTGPVHIKKQTNSVAFKNGVFWDVTPCGSCKKLRLIGT